MNTNVTRAARLGLATLFVAVLAMVPVSTVHASRNNNNRPLGNNGTVKVGDVHIDKGTANDPHVGCTFEVKWFGFDAGTQTSKVTFEKQGGDRSYKLARVHGDSAVVFEGAGPGNTLNTTKVYELNFTGKPHEQQGYHVKVTVNTTGSQGSDKKSKVFWVQDCEKTDEKPRTDDTEKDDDKDKVEVEEDDGEVLGGTDTPTTGGKEAGVVTGELAKTGVPTSPYFPLVVGLAILEVTAGLALAVRKQNI